MTVPDADVVVAGAGPMGLMLAGELALPGGHVVVVERRAGSDLVGVRAGGLHARTIEVLDQRGIADRFLARGQMAQVASFAWLRLDISDFPIRHPYGLALWQNRAHPGRLGRRTGSADPSRKRGDGFCPERHRRRYRLCE
jgi:2-polyprenyl-6-methoxyphenol hydroxylase-like FAD-dependent oxidoreductase